MANRTASDLGSLLASIGPITKHYRLETARLGERMIYHFALWTNTGRRVSAYGGAPLDAVRYAMEDLHAGRAKPSDARHRPRVLSMPVPTKPGAAGLRLVGEEDDRG